MFYSTRSRLFSHLIVPIILPQSYSCKNGGTTLSITTISIKGLFETFSIMALSITMLCHHAECHYAQWHILFTFMLNVVMLIVVMLSVIMLRVVAP
jgi:hypothetical protein